jgi:hypothetical protein
LLTSIPGLLPATAQRATAFLDPLWAQLQNDQTVQARILSGCVN